VLDCKEMSDQVLLYAAGALSDQEAEEVREHLAGGCPRCAGLLAEAEATVALLALTLPTVPPPANLRQRLMSRVGGEKEKASTPSAGGAVPWWMLIAIPSAIAAAVAAGITIFFALKLTQPVQSIPEEAAVNFERTVGVLTEAVERDEHDLAALRAAQPAQMTEWVTTPNLKLVSLTGTDKQPPGAAARVLWDADKGVWHFFGRGIKPAETGKTYELWFVSSDGKQALPAGEFDPTAQGDASLITNVPPEIADKLTIAAVTDEPAGKKITAPSGSFQLKGSLP
jgi:anti-sigma-K factor RskA